MPGFELVGKEEKNALNDIFEKSNGVLFAHGFDERRNHVFRVRDFEKSFSDKLGSPSAAACTSGTSAQYIAMKCLNIGPGDEVITQSFTFIATIEAILACGATPVICDIDHTFNMDYRSIENLITNKTKMIIPVHMLGNPARMDKISSIAKAHKLIVLEDACEALGAKFKGVSTGLIGDSGVFSLDFGKTITSGEGGMIVSKSNDIVEKCFQFIDHGHVNDKNYPRGMDPANIFGFNFRMTEMQAAVGIEQLKKLDFILAMNRKNKSIIMDYIRKCNNVNFREITDKEELADTIIFYFKNKMQTDLMINKINDSKIIGTKNVPDAMKWHFTGNFDQVWNNSNFYPNWQNEWEFSKDLLSRSVAIPIMVNWTEDQVNKIGKFLYDSLNEIK